MSARIACLIALTVVASTLRANAWPAPAAADGRRAPDARPETNAPDPSGRPERQDDDTPPKLQIVLNADVWDGSSARAASAVPSGTPLLPKNDATSTLDPTEPRTFVRLEAPWPGEPSQRCRLSGRYAHAPPVGV